MHSSACRRWNRTHKWTASNEEIHLCQLASSHCRHLSGWLIRGTKAEIETIKNVWTRKKGIGEVSARCSAFYYAPSHFLSLLNWTQLVQFEFCCSACFLFCARLFGFQLHCVNACLFQMRSMLSRFLFSADRFRTKTISKMRNSLRLIGPMHGMDSKRRAHTDSHTIK